MLYMGNHPAFSVRSAVGLMPRSRAVLRLGMGSAEVSNTVGKAAGRVIGWLTPSVNPVRGERSLTPNRHMRSGYSGCPMTYVGLAAIR